MFVWGDRSFPLVDCDATGWGWGPARWDVKVHLHLHIVISWGAVGFVHLHVQVVMIRSGVGVGWGLMFPPSLVLDVEVDAPFDGEIERLEYLVELLARVAGRLT